MYNIIIAFKNNGQIQLHHITILASIKQVMTHTCIMFQSTELSKS